MKENQLILYKQQVTGRQLVCYYLADGPWKEQFAEPYTWKFEYPIRLGSIPKELRVLPFLGAILPFALLNDAEVHVPYCTEDWANRIFEWQKQLSEQYPELTFSGTVVFDQLGTVEIQEKEPKKKKTLLYTDESRFLDTEIRDCEEIDEVLALRGAYSSSFISEMETAAHQKIQGLAELFSHNFQQILGNGWDFARDALSTMLPEHISVAEMMSYGAELVAVPYLWKQKKELWYGSVRTPEERAEEIQGVEERTGIHFGWDSLPQPGKTYEDPPMKYSNEYPPYVWLIGTPEHGNLGDHQIAESVIEFLKDIAPDTRIQEVRTKEYFHRKEELRSLIRPEDVLLFMGGGFFGNLWPEGDAVRRDAIVTWQDNQKIVFPQSAFFTEDEEGQEALKQAREIYCGDRLLLVFRDPVSYEIGRQNFDCPMLLTPDIVMYSAKTDVLKRKGALLLLRDDQEKKLPENSEKMICDMVQSAMGDAEVHCSDMRGRQIRPEGRKIALDQMFRRILSSEIVVTDRLHGLIFSVITGTPCVAFANDYHKIKSYEHWLHNTPYITVIEHIEELPEALQKVRSCAGTPYPAEQIRGWYAELKEYVDTYLKKAEKQRQSKIKQEAPLASIIIPIYNVEKYLAECLDSVIGQSYRNLEIICVNDGSTDYSPEILKDYEAKDSRIRVISQSNQGLSAARNAGAECATGKYILYLDSDDQLSLTALEELILKAEAEELDLLCFDAEAFASEETLDELLQKYLRFYHRQFVYPDLYKGSQMMWILRSHVEYQTSAWQYFLRADFLRENDLKFLPGILREDNPYTFEVMMLAKRAGHLRRKFYKRRIAGNSIMTAERSFGHVDGLFRGYLEMSRFLEQTEGLSEEEQELGIKMTERVLKMAQNEFVQMEEPGVWKEYPPILQRRFYHLVLEVLQNQRKQAESKMLDEKLQRTYYEKVRQGKEVKALKKDLTRLQNEKTKLLEKEERLAEIRRSWIYRILHKLRLIP